MTLAGNTNDRRAGQTTARVCLTETEARTLTDEVKTASAALWAKLLSLYEGAAHTALGYSSWGKYFEAEFGGSDATAYRLLQSARVMEQLPIGSRPSSEGVARELAPVLREDPERVEEVWSKAVEDHGPSPTAKQVREVVRAAADEPEVETPGPPAHISHDVGSLAREIIGGADLTCSWRSDAATEAVFKWINDEDNTHELAVLGRQLEVLDDDRFTPLFEEVERLFAFHGDLEMLEGALSDIARNPLSRDKEAVDLLIPTELMSHLAACQHFFNLSDHHDATGRRL
jgi:hypothetical protein